jgi:hypothetical protein
LGGAACIVGAAFFWLRLPTLRGEARQLIVAQQMSGGTPPEEMTATPAIQTRARGRSARSAARSSSRG